MGRLFEIQHVAGILNKEQKLVLEMSSGLYAVEQQNDEPTNFRRIDKDRRIKGKARKQNRREQRRMLRAADNFQKIASGQ